MHISCLSIHFLHCTAWHWDWWLWWPAQLLFPQWLCSSWKRCCGQSLHSKICCTFAALQAFWHCGWGTSGSQWIACAFLIAPITNVGHQNLVLESSVHPIVYTSGFLPVALNFDISFWLVLDELLGPLLTILGFTEVWGQSWCWIGDGYHLCRKF